MVVFTCLSALPRGGRYSAQKLVELSASRLSHQKPHDWYRIVDKFERENMGFILLKGEVSLNITHVTSTLPVP